MQIHSKSGFNPKFSVDFVFFLWELPTLLVKLCIYYHYYNKNCSGFTSLFYLKKKSCCAWWHMLSWPPTSSRRSMFSQGVEQFLNVIVARQMPALHPCGPPLAPLQTSPPTRSHSLLFLCFIDDPPLRFGNRKWSCAMHAAASKSSVSPSDSSSDDDSMTFL
jgi:hypothetical protein